MTGESFRSWRKPLLVLLAALAVAVFLAPLASPNPDGLDRVARDLGFAAREGRLHRAPLPGYTIPGLSLGRWTPAAAGLLGALLTCGLAWGVAALATRRKAQDPEPGHPRR